MADETEKTSRSRNSAEAPSTDSPRINVEKTGQGVQSTESSRLDTREAKQTDRTEKKDRGRMARNVPSGIAHIKATFNNTIVSITDLYGGVIAWSSAGRVGFSGSRKSTAFAATLVGQESGRQAVGRGMREIEVHVQGAGAGRESAIRALQSSGLSISVIKDVTPIPHNGCRAKKRRRV